MSLACNLTFSYFLALCLTVDDTSAEEISFNRDIRPILSDNCFFCHGPDEKTQEAGLRLDRFEDATRDLGGYSAIIPGKSDASELLQRVMSHDDPMPPAESKKSLTAKEIKLLEEWIDQGAKYEAHWSFMPLRTAELPSIQRRDWPKNPIDHFVLARLEQDGIEPSPEADRPTLIRRLYLDLIGLLPTPDQLQQFLNDKDPLAYERLVEQLLKSRHYGERWGRHWLDQARYADSNGYSIDSLREMWPYRDWVIKSVNDDMPFDQFTIEQIAGDLLPNPTKLQRIATGFHRNTLINQEGGSDGEQFRVEAAMDRVSTTGAVWLGLTIGCAQCHSHKFDPITQREYYELYAFFDSGTDRNNSGKTLQVTKGEVFGSPADLGPGYLTDQERKELQRKWEKLEKQRLNDLPDDGPAETEWTILEASSVATGSGKELKRQPDHSHLLQPGHEVNDSIEFAATSNQKRIGAVRLRVIPHDSLPKNGPGAAGNGNFVLTGFEVYVGDQRVEIKHVFADHEQKGYPIASAINGDKASGWAINAGTSGRPMNAPHEATFVFTDPVDTQGKPIRIRLLHGMNENYLVGHFAIDVTPSSPTATSEHDSGLRKTLAKPSDQRSKSEKEEVEARFLAAHPEAKKKKKHRFQANMMIMEDRPEPRDTYLLTRGDFTRPNKELGRLYPGGLSQVAPALPAQADRTRMDLAKWLVHPENPLTPRVTMNRVWMRYFGRGLVETEEDFGTQGTPPTHPELLDWLGLKLIENDWSMKSMHRLIVTSATYRQQSHSRKDLMDKDPGNYLLARQSRIRVDAELVRDSALCASGLLAKEIGGPGVYPSSTRWRLLVHPEQEELEHSRRRRPISACDVHDLLSQRSLSAFHHL